MSATVFTIEAAKAASPALQRFARNNIKPHKNIERLIDAFGRKQAAKGKAVSEAKRPQTIPLAKRKEEA